MAVRPVIVSLRGRKNRHNGCLDDEIWMKLLLSVAILMAGTQSKAELVRAECTFSGSYSFDGSEVTDHSADGSDGESNSGYIH